MFGWCDTGHHEGCILQFENWGQKGQFIVCECECHGPKKTGETASGELSESRRGEKTRGAASGELPEGTPGREGESEDAA